MCPGLPLHLVLPPFTKHCHRPHRTSDQSNVMENAGLIYCRFCCGFEAAKVERKVDGNNNQCLGFCLYKTATTVPVSAIANPNETSRTRPHSLWSRALSLVSDAVTVSPPRMRLSGTCQHRNLDTRRRTPPHIVIREIITPALNSVSGLG